MSGKGFNQIQIYVASFNTILTIKKVPSRHAYGIGKYTIHPVVYQGFFIDNNFMIILILVLNIVFKIMRREQTSSYFVCLSCDTY